MAFDRTFLRFTFGGRHASTEIWECNWSFAASDGGVMGWPDTGIDLSPAFNAVSTAFTSSALSTGVALEWVKVAYINRDGLYQHDPVDYYGTVKTGNIASLQSSPQDSLCVTLWSGSSLGKANYGRFYLPWSGATVDRTTGKVASSSITSIMTAWRTAMNTVTADWQTRFETPYLSPHIMSQAGPSKRAYWMRLGDVVDTQRRRRNHLREAYQQVALS